ncbi:hypothetical protein Tsubulata_005592 [Turnera subulata]|uniref:NADH dehydrogenase [ubiquinone] 1 alpha subcomplex subunit 6 n=1 Tax=Turnera subulata TaxID=218843 RepID=A0A9Q0GFC4_9ROSI|nr:hypothetical protein Tsubulata_005592 [Turnera subulata]
MAFRLTGVRVAANSGSLEEARGRVFEFFKSACRSIPQIMEIYNLHDVISESQLRSNIASQFRRNAHITNPKGGRGLQVIDMLVFKGMEELGNIVEHAKQRHHIIGQYVVGQHGLVQDLNPKDDAISPFLNNFYKTNYS